jgi:hypothetical protein
MVDSRENKELIQRVVFLLINSQKIRRLLCVVTALHTRGGKVEVRVREPHRE